MLTTVNNYNSITIMKKVSKAKGDELMELIHKFEEGVEYGTVSDVAEHLEVSRQRVHVLLKSERLGNCVKDDTPRGAVWYIPKPFKVIQGKDIGRPKNDQ